MEPVNPLLPALRPATSGLLRRAGGLLETVRGIQQEASAEWWYEQGMEHKSAERWPEASTCFDKAIQLDDWYALAWLYNALASCNLGDLTKFHTCIVYAHLRGIFIEGWDIRHTLTVDEWQLVRNQVRPGYLTSCVIDYAYDYGEHPFDWESLSTAQSATQFIHKILAASVLSYYDDIGGMSWDFSGDWAILSQPSALGVLIDKIFFSEGILSEFYYPCDNKEENYVSFFTTTGGKEVKVPTKEHCTLLHYFTQDDIELLITVTASFLNRVKYRTIKYQERVNNLGFDNAQIRFFAGLKQLTNEQFIVAGNEFETCLLAEEKFALSDLLWENLARAKTLNQLIPWDCDALNYSSTESKTVVSQADAEVAITYLEKSATLKRNDACAWLRAANNTVWYLRDFNRAKSLYNVALKIIKEGDEKMLIPKLWALFNYAQVCQESNCYNEAQSIGKYTWFLIEEILKLYWTDSDHSIEKLDTNLSFNSLMQKCSEWINCLAGSYPVGESVSYSYPNEVQAFVRQDIA